MRHLDSSCSMHHYPECICSAPLPRRAGTAGFSVLSTEGLGRCPRRGHGPFGSAFRIREGLALGIGANLSWIDVTKEAVFTSDRTVAILRAGDTRAYVNGDAVTLSAPPDAESGRMAIAAPDIRALGLRVEIDGQSRIIKVSWPRSRIRSTSVSVDHGVIAVLIEADTPFKFSDFVLRSPDRVVIDIYDAVLEPSVSTFDVDDEVVTRVRAAMNRPGVVRVVVDLASALGYAVEYTTGAPARLAIRFHTQITHFSLDGIGHVSRLSMATTGRTAFSAPQVDAEGVAFIDFSAAELALDQAELAPDDGPVKWARISRWKPEALGSLLSSRRVFSHSARPTVRRQQSSSRLCSYTVLSAII